MLKYPRLPRSVHVQSVETVKPSRYMSTCRGWRPWNSQACEAVYVLMALVVAWWLCNSSSGETRKFDFLGKIWPWRSRSIAPQNNRDLNQVILHPWSKFDDPTLNGLWVMMWKSSKWARFLLFKLNLTLKIKVDCQPPTPPPPTPPPTTGSLIKVLCISGLNLVIPGCETSARQCE